VRNIIKKISKKSIIILLKISIKTVRRRRKCHWLQSTFSFSRLGADSYGVRSCTSTLQFNLGHHK